MYRVTGGEQFTRALVNRILSGMVALPIAAILSVATLKLFTGITVPTQFSVVGDFTAPVFTGYADHVCVFSGPVNTGGATQGLITDGTFIAVAGAPYVPDTVTGYLLVDFNGVLVCAERFTTAVPFSAPGDFLEMDLIVPLGTFQDAAL